MISSPVAVAVGSVVQTPYGLRTVVGVCEGPAAVSTMPVLAAVLPPEDDRHVLLDLDDGHWVWGHQVTGVVPPSEGLSEAGVAALRAAQTELARALSGFSRHCPEAERVGFAVVAMYNLCARSQAAPEGEEGGQE